MKFGFCSLASPFFLRFKDLFIGAKQALEALDILEKSEVSLLD